MTNRQQRRAAAKHKGKRPGETYADVLAKRKMIKEAVDRSVHDESVAIESDIKTQRFIWMSVVAQNIAFGHAGVRTQRYFLALDEVREELEKMAEESGRAEAPEELARIGFTTPESVLSRLVDMASGIEYLHNFQRERNDIVEYVRGTHEILKVLKGDCNGKG